MFKNKTKKMKMVVKFIIFSQAISKTRERDDGNGNGSVE